MTPVPMTPGDTVRWWTKDGGWRFGHLASIGRTVARVQVGGAVRRVPLADLSPWPPVRQDDDEKNTTPPRRVKRGRNA
jgi:hypothetical protein